MSGDSAVQNTVTLPIGRMLAAGGAAAGAVGLLTGLIAMAWLGGSAWPGGLAGAGTAWAVSALCVAGAVAVLGRRQAPTAWGFTLFGAQAVSLVACAGGSLALLYSAPSLRSEAFVPAVVLAFVGVWIGFARSFGAVVPTAAGSLESGADAGDAASA